MGQAAEIVVGCSARQIEVLSDLTSRRIYYASGMGGGKTFAMVEFALSRSAMNPPECLGMIVEPTYPMVNAVLIPEFEKAFKRWNASATYNKMEHRWTWGPEQRSFWLRSAEDPIKLSGPTLAFAGLDEAAQMSEEAFRRTSTRVRDKRARITQMMIGSTHEGTSSWFNRHIQKILKAGERSRNHVVQGTTYDNAHMSPEFFEDIEEVFAGDPAGRQNYILGVAAARTGNIYTCFSNDNVKPFGGLNGAKIVLGWDFNVGHMVTTVGAWWETQQTLHIFGEIVSKSLGGTTTEEHAEKVARWLVDNKHAVVVQDARGKKVYTMQRVQAEACIDASGTNRHSSASKSDAAAVHDAGFWPVHDRANPLVRNRIAAVQKALRSKRLLVCPRGAPTVLQALREHARDKDGNPQKKWKDDRETPLDHYSDALGYSVWQTMPVRSLAGRAS